MDMSDSLPKILLCTPELTFWPESESVSIKRFGRAFQHFPKKRLFQKIGGLADITTTLAVELKQKGVNVAIALPHIRAAAEPELAHLIDRQIEKLGSAGISHWKHNLFLIQHDYFNNINRIYGGDGILFSLTLQRLILNALIPRLKPDLIHTHDWLTGLIGPLSHPDIKSLHTIHNFYTKTVPMSLLYNFGLPLYNADKLFWVEGFNHNRVDFQLSGIFGSDYINTPSQGWLSDIVSGRVPSWTNPGLIEQVRNKFESLHAFSVLNAPDPSYAPEIDSSIYENFSLENVFEGKTINKRKFQKEMWLRQDKIQTLH
jgi:glycogen synthase